MMNTSSFKRLYFFLVMIEFNGKLIEILFGQLGFLIHLGHIYLHLYKLLLSLNFVCSESIILTL